MQDQRALIFYGAIVVAIVLAIVGVLYWGGHGPFIAGVHHKHAILCWALAVGALVVANFNRPGVAMTSARR
jgi:hypothetical protein